LQMLSNFFVSLRVFLQVQFGDAILQTGAIQT
jgi:hypothetical protein